MGSILQFPYVESGLQRMPPCWAHLPQCWHRYQLNWTRPYLGMVLGKHVNFFFLYSVFCKTERIGSNHTRKENSTRTHSMLVSSIQIGLRAGNCGCWSLSPVSRKLPSIRLEILRENWTHFLLPFRHFVFCMGATSVENHIRHRNCWSYNWSIKLLIASVSIFNNMFKSV